VQELTALAAALALPLKIAPSMILLHGAIIDSKRGFLRKIVRGEIFSVGTQISIKVPKYGGDISM